MKSKWTHRTQVAVALFGLLAAGCVTPQQRRDAELEALVSQLAGRYDNGTQVRANAASGGAAPHAALTLTITPLYVPLVARHVLHVRETASDDPRRIVLQRIWTFDYSADRRIVQGVMQLVEPERWRAGDPQLFRSLLPQDLRPQSGCELIWQKTPQGFTAQNQRSACRVSSSASEDSVNIEYRAELNGDQLALAEVQFDAAGQVLLGGGADPFYRFNRRSR